jgi:hypothetical protein
MAWCITHIYFDYPAEQWKESFALISVMRVHFPILSAAWAETHSIAPFCMPDAATAKVVFYKWTMQ